MPVTTSLLVAGSLLFLLGILLLQRGLWPPRRGHTPHCGRCEYNLTGRGGEVCPECGGDINEAGIVRGQRHRRVGLAATGAVLGLLGLMAVASITFGVVQRTNWCPYAPAWWLVSRVSPPETNRAAAAWAELMRRDAKGELSAAARSPLIRACLAAQADEKEGGLLNRQLDYLGKCFGQGLLSQAQCDWFFSKMVKMELKVRPRVRLGDRLPWGIEATTRMPAGFVLVFRGGLRHGRGIVNDAPNESSVEAHVYKDVHSTESRNMQQRCVEMGRQEVSLAGTVEVYEWVHKPGGGMPGAMYYSQAIALPAELEVVPADAEDVRKVADESLRAVLQKEIRPPALRIDRSKGRPDGKVRIAVADSGGWNGPAKPPMDLAFDILVRVNNREYQIGRASFRKDGGPSYSWELGYEGPTVRAVDVILRSSVEVARKTVDITEIWDGELVYPNAPVSGQ